MKIAPAFLSVALLAAVQAFPPFGGPDGPLMPGFSMLPSETQATLNAIFKDASLSWLQRQKKIHEVMRTVPDDIKEKMPPYAGFEKLPQDVQVQLKAIHMSKTLTYEQKNEQIKAIFDKLPKEALYQLPYPALPQGFEVLPADIKAQIKAIGDDTTISHQERDEKIMDLLDSLPEEIRATLPEPPPCNGCELLPADVQARIKEVNSQKTLKFRERKEKVQQIVDALPEHVRAVLPPPPPQGFLMFDN